MNGKALLSFLNVSHNLGIYIEFFTDVDYFFGNFRPHVNFHSVSHIEHLIHFFPICSGAIMDGFEQRWYGEHVVFDYFAVVVDEMEHFRLGSACAMHHAMNLRPHFIQHSLDDRRVGTSGGENQLTCVYGRTFYGVCQLVTAAVDQFGWYSMVVALRIILGQILAEDIMTCRSQAITTHAAIVTAFIRGLSRGTKADYNVTRFDVGVVNYIGSFHAASDG